MYFRRKIKETSNVKKIKTSNRQKKTSKHEYTGTRRFKVSKTSNVKNGKTNTETSKTGE